MDVADRPGAVVRPLAFHGDGGRLILEREDVSVCPEDPGLRIDLVVEARTPDLYGVYIGRTTLEAERAEGRIEVRGRPSMVSAFPEWMAWSPFAEASRQSVSAVG